MGITRRDFLEKAAVASGAAVVGGAALRPWTARAAESPPPTGWDALREEVGDRLIDVPSPVAACAGDGPSAACNAAFERLGNPFFIQDQPGGTQTNGWLDAWTAALSSRAVAAESADDIAAAVDFAREHHVKLVIKGAGHDYKGRSNASDSLLVWTHRMRDVTFHDAFRAAGAPAGAPVVPALTAAAGARWIDAYRTATANRHYVQGGGCTTVGVAGGFIQGGGYGSFSKRFGTGAGGVLEFEVVTADGKLRTANEFQHPDLFWALRGGGGGTFGVVTRVTLLAHQMPKTIGLFRGKITATSDDAFRALIERLVAFYPEALNDPAWGEQIGLRPDNSVELFMTYLDLDSVAARAVWHPIEEYVAQRPDLEGEMSFDTHPFDRLWDASYWEKVDPTMIQPDGRPDAEPGNFWWATNQGEVAEFLYCYQSRWIPLSLFASEAAAGLAATLFEASRHAAVGLHINKGLAGEARDARARDRQTSIHPAVFDAAMLAIIARRQRAFPGVAGHEPDLAAGRAVAQKASQAMAVIRRATPGAGTYGNESDYFEKDWKQAFYGPSYDRLLEVKRKYDPDNLFRVHHGVGSDL